MGFRLKLPTDIIPNSDPQIYLAASDSERAAQLHDLWNDPKVRAIMAVRGGFGCLRMLGLVNYHFLAKNPKLIIGFSDLTSLLSAALKKANLISLHGPVVTTLGLSDDTTVQSLYECITGNWDSCQINQKTAKIKILRSGIGYGKLLPGNLTTMVHLIGTPWEPIWEKAIMMVEDTGEPLYKLDRLFTHLDSAGKLAKLSGLILGSFDNNGLTINSDKLRQRVIELTLPYSYPVWADFPIGHLSKNLTIPMGMEATMDSHGQALHIHP
jgi:muramoyltetrapeptide carboxypeptidase